MRVLLWCVLLFGSFLACKSDKNNREGSRLRFVQEWKTQDGLVGCESVLYDSLNQCLYVSNSPEYAFTAKGYIAKYGLDGSLQDSTWLTGLNRPTGMAVSDGRLYIADIDRVVAIDLISQNTVQEYRMQQYDRPGLNDIAVNARGEIFITASNIGAVFKVESDSLSIWSQDTVVLKWANGILALDKELVVVGDKITRIPYNTRITEVIDLKPSVSDFDGLQQISTEEFLVSTAGGEHQIWKVNLSGSAELVQTFEHYAADFEWISSERSIIIPGGHTATKTYHISKYQISRIE